MTAQILEFSPGASLRPPVAQFIRVGEAHRKFGELFATGHLAAARFVFLASRAPRQKSLIDALRGTGAELVLDPQTAELASLQKFHGHERNAPWGRHCADQPLGPQHFAPGAASDVIGDIARFAVRHGFHVVLAPTHYLDDPRFGGWLTVDHRACLALRTALDREGGRAIRIDYPVLHAQTALYRAEVRSRIMEAVGDLPVDNLWLRSSGITGDAGPQSTRQFLGALAGLHNAGKPVILDYLGGTLGLAALAFGLASGKSHGVGEMERFAAQQWHKPPRHSDGFGRTERLSVPQLGRTLTRAEFELLNKARGGKKLLSCQDRNCCRDGIGDMVHDHRRHLLHQTAADIAALEGIPALRRAEWFLENPLETVVRRSRDIARLKPPAAEAGNIDAARLMKRLADHARLTEKVHRSLESLLETRSEDAPRARPAGAPRTEEPHMTLETQ